MESVCAGSRTAGAEPRLGPPLTRGEKALYQQIHPEKIAMDVVTTFLAVVILWQHELLPGLAVTFLPAILASAAVVRWADLEGRRDSPFGRYVRRYMTSSMQALRAAGAAVMLVGTWFWAAWALPLGLALILLGWPRGVIAPGRPAGTRKA